MKRMRGSDAGSSILVGRLVGGGSLALADGGEGSQIHACVANSSGFVRIVGADQACKPSETTLDWAIQGPAGPAGATELVLAKRRTSSATTPTLESSAWNSPPGHIW